MVIWILGLFAVYLCFYAGSFNTNTRYSIQIVAPITILAASFTKRPFWIIALLLSALIPVTRSYGFTPYLEALQADHQLSILFASRVQPDDLVISGLQEIFIDNGRKSINASFASMAKQTLEDELRKGGKAWYHADVRSSVVDSEEWRANRWVKSNYELHLIDSHEVAGYSIDFYELLTNRIDGAAR
jgi:hypothetical protein